MQLGRDSKIEAVLGRALLMLGLVSLLGLAGGIGAALGELTGYFLGARGRRVVEGWSLYARLVAVTSRWTGPMLLVLAALPIPFDLAGVWAGTTRYPLSRFLLFVTPGKIIKVTLVGLAGYYSVGWLLGPLG